MKLKALLLFVSLLCSSQDLAVRSFSVEARVSKAQRDNLAKDRFVLHMGSIW